jgi:hypothetical protein
VFAAVIQHRFLVLSGFAQTADPAARNSKAAALFGAAQLFGRQLELDAGVNAALRPADKPGNRWWRAW